MKISVCLASFNGAKFIRDQIESILPQLSACDELIISDDSSTDNTIEIINEINDSRIILISNQKFRNPIFNFENSISHATGDIIFLSDQDDIWHPDKVSIFKSAFMTRKAQLIISDCIVVDQNMNTLYDSYFALKKIPEKGNILKSLISNPYLGCCMAFDRIILNKILPFPKQIPMHDIWIGTICRVFFRVEFIKEKLIYYRRHDNNATPYTSSKSENSLSKKIKFRLDLLISFISVLQRPK